jgi:MFS family permease
MKKQRERDMSDSTAYAKPLAAAHDNETDRERASVYRKVTWRLMPILIFGFILAWIDRVNIGFAKLSMLQDLGFSDAMYGLGAGIFFIGYFLFEVPSNIAMARIGARKTLARITILWGITSICMMYVRSPEMFYLMRFLLGACEAGFFPGVILYLTYWYPAARRAKANGLFMTSFAIAGAIGGPISGYIMGRMVGVGSLSNWQWLFLIEGIPSVLFGIALLFILPDRPAAAAWLSEQEKLRIEHDLSLDVAATAATGGLRSAMGNPRLWLCALIFFCLVAGNATLAFWVPTIIKDLGVKDVFTIGLLAAIPFFAGTIAMVINAAHSDRSGERAWHCSLASLLAAAGLVATGMMMGSGMQALFALTLAAIGVLAAMPIFWSFPPTFLAGSAAAGGIALINCLANLAGFAAPYAMGALKTSTGSVASGLYLVAGLEVLAAVVVLATFSGQRSRRLGPTGA